MSAKKIILKKNEEKRITNGHLWVFSNEIQEIAGAPEIGDVVEAYTHGGNFLGIGFFNPHSLIALRLLSRQREEIDFQFFLKRLESALTLRKMLYPDMKSFRLVHGEGDFLPGLIIDKYNDYLSIQTFSYGMDKRLTLICDVLESLLQPKGIVERNEALIRTLEGLEQRKGILRGALNPIVITEYGVHYTVDLLEGQKTGFFLDQRENRRAIRRYARGNTVLDCFCSEGGFAFNAACGDATSVVGVDISGDTVRRAEENARLNHMEGKTTFVTADVFEYLAGAVAEKRMFQLINLDPPSFAKSKKTVRKAKRGYKELHNLAFQVLVPGGILSTASCSHHIYEETFLEIVTESARSAGRQVTQLEWHGAAPDHPVLPSMPETRYLKFGIFRVE